MKKTLLSGVLAVAMLVLAGIYATGVSAQPVQPAAQTWSVAVHIEYPNGFVYDHAFVTGVAASDLKTYLQACGQSHRDQNWLRLYCYAFPD